MAARGGPDAALELFATIKRNLSAIRVPRRLDRSMFRPPDSGPVLPLAVIPHFPLVDLVVTLAVMYGDYARSLVGVDKKRVPRAVRAIIESASAKCTIRAIAEATDTGHEAESKHGSFEYAECYIESLPEPAEATLPYIDGGAIDMNAVKHLHGQTEVIRNALLIAIPRRLQVGEFGNTRAYLDAISRRLEAIDECVKPALALMEIFSRHQREVDQVVPRRWPGAIVGSDVPAGTSTWTLNRNDLLSNLDENYDRLAKLVSLAELHRAQK
jgi:hypothetical protein